MNCILTKKQNFRYWEIIASVSRRGIILQALLSHFSDLIIRLLQNEYETMSPCSTTQYTLFSRLKPMYWYPEKNEKTVSAHFKPLIKFFLFSILNNFIFLWNCTFCFTWPSPDSHILGMTKNMNEVLIKFYFVGLFNCNGQNSHNFSCKYVS